MKISRKLKIFHIPCSAVHFHMKNEQIEYQPGLTVLPFLQHPIISKKRDFSPYILTKVQDWWFASVESNQIFYGINLSEAGVVKILEKVTRKHLLWSYVLNKVAGWWLTTLLKKRLQYRCSPMIFAKSLTTPISKKNSKQCFWPFIYLHMDLCVLFHYIYNSFHAITDNSGTNFNSIYQK